MEQFDRSEHVRPQPTAVARHEDNYSSADGQGRRWFMATGAVAFVLLLAGALAFLVHPPEPPVDTVAPINVELQRQSAEQNFQLFVAELEANSLRLGDISAASAEQQIVVGQVAFPMGPADRGVQVGPAPTADPWFLGTGLLWLVPPMLVLLVWPYLSFVRREQHDVAHP